MKIPSASARLKPSAPPPLSGQCLRAYHLLAKSKGGITMRDIIPFANSPHFIIKQLRDLYHLPIKDQWIREVSDKGKRIKYKRYFLEEL